MSADHPAPAADDQPIVITVDADDPRYGFGVDVGGSGVKGGIVDLETGELVGDRFKITTPQPATPDAVAATVAQIVAHFGWTGRVGITLPSVVAGGVVRTAANIDKAWIGTDPYELFGRHLSSPGLSVLNDADAAGLAYDAVFGWITLQAHTSLEAVGLTAAVSTALARVGLSCNVLAGYYHDHLLVPADHVDEAVEVLGGLQA